MSSPYRQDREPCRECARREAEAQLKPREPGWMHHILWSVLVLVIAMSFVVALRAVLDYSTAAAAAEQGTVEHGCKPDGTCFGNLVCRDKSNGYVALYCMPPRENP